ncbi:MAG: Universal stress protein family [Gaiellaceae bacterium]|jgi:nucleotide-binding universal stress UspA family protein|nr:Universal stress protein family [Gaiellaceae bacterium]
MSSRPRSIVVAYDDSDASGRALDAAADRVGYATSLSVVHVRTADMPGHSAVEGAREHLMGRRVTARYLERVGRADEEVVAAARETGADLLVVGSRNGEGADLGSTSSSILRSAPCDVLVVN